MKVSLVGAPTGYPKLHVLVYVGVLAPVLPEMPGYVLLESMMLAGFLVWISVVDLRRFIIPDFASFSLMLSGLTTVAIIDLDLLSLHAIGAVIAWGVFACISQLFRAWRGYDGLGLGDAKLAAGAASWIGPWAMPSMVLLASLLAITVLVVVNRIGPRSVGLNRRSGIAFGPFLAFSTWVTWIYGPVI